MFSPVLLRDLFWDPGSSMCLLMAYVMLHNLYSSPSTIRVIKSRMMRWVGHIARMREKRNSYRIFVGNPEEKRPLGRPRRKCVDNIKVDLREIGWNGVDWIDMAQDRDQWRALVNTVLNLRVS
jgi:hypothetical protein